MFAALLDEQQKLEEYGPDHPSVRAIRTRINLIREHFGKDPLPEEAQHTDILRVYIDSLGEELKIAQQGLAKYDTLFAQESKAAKDISASQIEDETYRSEITRTQQMFNVVVKRLEEINLIKDYGGVSTKLISPPEMGVQIAPQLLKIMLQGGFLGLFAGCGLVYLLDVMDKSFRSPAEIRRQLDLPVIGHIPQIEKPESNGAVAHGEAGVPLLDPILCSYHHRRGRPAEAYRAVRTSLFFSIRREDQKVIQITSANPGDGKTTLAANLAISMADAGKKVLLVDADFRRPRQHTLFGLADTVGLRSVLMGEAEIPDAVQKTAVDNLWALTAGGTPNNPADLLTSMRFKELLDSQRDQYDFVIIDTPPVLAVTDACVIAPRADAVLLVIRLGKDARMGSIHAVETLTELGSQILGVVVNGTGMGAAYGTRHHQYYKYQYNGYHYHYGYGDKKGNRNGDVYYHDDAASPTNGKASNGKASHSDSPPQSPNHADAIPPEV
jgi:capsular exopolysaccharide synthesis family protein